MAGEDPILDQMQRLVDMWDENGDRRAIFLGCYSLMTRNMLEAVKSGGFEDEAWVSELLHRFAAYYFQALEAYTQEPESAPGVWQLAFKAAHQPHTHVLQILILGMNAHINYDLVFALAELLEPEWSELSPEGRQKRYRDHCQVNEIIYQTINSVQDQVVERYSRAMDLVDKLMGPVDEWLTSGLISDWREEVWENATLLIQTPGMAEREALLRQVEQHSLRRAHSILGEEGITGLIDLI